MDKQPTISAKDYFTEAEWADLMFATAPEVKRIMAKVAERRENEAKKLPQ